MYVRLATIITPSKVQSALINLVSAYSRTTFGDFGHFSSANIFDTWLQPHIRHVCPYGTQLRLQESVD